MYHGKKKLNYTQLHSAGVPPTPVTRWQNIELPRSFKGGVPQEFIEAIMQWLDENLSPIIKRGINFQKIPNRMVRIVTNSDLTDVRRNGQIGFFEDHVRVDCSSGRIWECKSEWSLKFEYANPKFFDLLKQSLGRFYNGQ